MNFIRISASCVFIAICFFNVSCSNYKSKEHPFRRDYICNNLMVVTYRVGGGGGYGGDMIAEYLTDSKNFQKYIGVWNDGLEEILYDCKGDTIIVSKYSTADFVRKLVEKKVLLLSELKAKKIFE